MQRVVILGGSGFVGSAIGKALAGKYEVIAVSRRDCDFTQAESREVIARMVKDGDIVVCAAARAPAKNYEMLLENVALITHTAEALRPRKLAYVLNISSDAVYGDSMEKLSETSMVAPGSAHGIMHCMREYILEKNLSAPVGHLRPTLIYGENDPHNGYGPNSFLRLAQAGKNIELFGEGEERRDHIYVGDVAKLAVAMIERSTRGPVNAVTGTVISFMDIARIAAAGKSQIVSKPRSGPMPHNGYRAFDNSAARKLAPGLQFTQLESYLRQAG